MYITIDNYDYKIIPNMFGDNSPISHLRNNKCYKRVSFNNWVYQSELEKDIPEDDADWFMEVYLNEKGRLKIKLGDTIQTVLENGDTRLWSNTSVSTMRLLHEYIEQDMIVNYKEKPAVQENGWNYITDNNFPEEETIIWAATTTSSNQNHSEVHRAIYSNSDWYDVDHNMNKIERSHVYAWKDFEAPVAPIYR